MNQTYQKFLEESTNTAKAKRNLGQIILFSTYFMIWIVAMIIFGQAKEVIPLGLDISLRWILLPLLLLLSTVAVIKNNYLGSGNWFCVIGAAITFLTVPYTDLVEEMGTTTFTFRFPNIMYMVVGIIISICGIGIGTLCKKKFSATQSNTLS